MKSTCVISLILGLCCQHPAAIGQAPIAERQAEFRAAPENGALRFTPVLPPLLQRAGAPPAFYDYYWEFGDGHFSFEENPLHAYPAAGTYDTYLLATGKYDNGKAPRSRKKKTQAPPPNESIAALSPAVLPSPSANLGMQAVRNPSPSEEFVCIVQYANRTPVTQSGKLYLFYNQRDYSKSHFSFPEARTHHGELPVADALADVPPPGYYDTWATTRNSPWLTAPAPLDDRSPEEQLATLEALYREVNAWRFDGLKPGATRNLFLTLQAAEAMLRDTSAIISLSGYYLSDDRRIAERFDLELEIVASHDPNFIAVSRCRLGFRRIRNKDLSYKVHFQNTGEGPASRVQVTCRVPQGLTAKALEVLDYSPACPLCPKGEIIQSCLDTAIFADSVVFTFRNIYLPGTRQHGVSDRDSTKGFIKYRLRPGRHIQKKNLGARASIVFDKNPPIRTNRAPTRFKTGLSFAPMFGRTYDPYDNAPGQYQLGLALAPYKPYRFFLQAEVWGGLPTERSTLQEMNGDTSWFAPVEDVTGMVHEAIFDSMLFQTTQLTLRTSHLHLIPLQLRCNLSGSFSLGAGVQGTLVRRQTDTHITTQTNLQVTDLITGELLAQYSMDYPPQTTENTQKDYALKAAVFADLHIGGVRAGPATGLRGLLPLESGAKPTVLLFVYWKF